MQKGKFANIYMLNIDSKYTNNFICTNKTDGSNESSADSNYW